MNAFLARLVGSPQPKPGDCRAAPSAAAPQAIPHRGAAPITVIAHDVRQLGGMERILYELVRGLRADGREVTVIARTFDPPDVGGVGWLRVPGPVRPFPLAYGWFAILAHLKLRAHARKHPSVVLSMGAVIPGRVDIVNVQYCHRAAKRAARERRQTRNRARWLNARLSRFVALVGEAHVYRPRKAGILVAASKGVAQELSESYPSMKSRIVTIPNGVDLDQFRPNGALGSQMRQELGIPHDAFTVIFVGGDWERKGLPLLVDAVSCRSSVHLIVVGHGTAVDTKSLVESEVARLHFVGPVVATAAHYSAADALCLPSSYEAFPLVVLEAAACGLPAIITPVNGAVDIVVDGETGLVVERSPEAIGKAIETLAANAQMRLAMGRTSRARARGYAWSAMVARYCAMLDA